MKRHNSRLVLEYAALAVPLLTALVQLATVLLNMAFNYQHHHGISLVQPVRD